MARANGPVVVCVINLKGGVGKSTISALLARNAFKRRGLDVLAIDLDPQANLSQALMHSNYTNFINKKRTSIVEIFNGYKPPSPKSGAPTTLGANDGTELIDYNPSNNNSLQLIASRFDFSNALLGAVSPNRQVLAKFIADHYQHKDFIIIDCSPTESVFTTSAYHASGLVLVPVKPEYFATIGFPLLQQSLSSFRNANRGHAIDVCGVVINNAFYDGGNDGGPEKAESLVDINHQAALNKWPVFKNQLPHSRGFPKIMRGNDKYSGNAWKFIYFSNEFFGAVGL